MRLAVALIVSLLLAACAGEKPDVIAPQVIVVGPKFAPTRFDCGQKPIEPDPAAVADKAGSAAARYEDDLKYWGQRCSNKMQSVHSELKAAGQVTE